MTPVPLLVLAFGAYAADDTCVPSCRDGYVCYEGECISACNPACPDGQHCTGDGECIDDERRREPHADPDPGPRPRGGPELKTVFFSTGVGPTLGNTFGMALDLELGLGGAGHYFSARLFGLGGINGDGNAISQSGLGFGYRGFYGRTTRFSFFAGPMVTHRFEFGSRTYRYIVMWPRVDVGFISPLSDSAFWGIEAGFAVGYQIHYNGGDYSSINGCFDTRFRVQF